MPHPADRLLELISRTFQAHPWHGVPTRPGAGAIVNAYVEIVPTDTVKYELDKPTGHLRLDRPQRFSSVSPTLYGFVPQTYCGPKVAARCTERSGIKVEGDQDPIDICILTEKTAAHGNFLAHAKPIGGFRMIDKGQADDKILAVLEADLSYGDIDDVSELVLPLLDRLQHYFLTYKQGPHASPTQVEIAEIYGHDEAEKVIALAVEDYRDKFGPADGWATELRSFIKSS